MKPVPVNYPDNKKQDILRDRNLHIIFGVTLMVVLGVSSITPAFPKISRALKIDYKNVVMLVTVFTFPGIFLTPVLGVLADRFGRKKILVPSLFLFGIAGGSCFFADGFNQLLVLRFIQGVGASSLGAINVTIIGDLYTGRERMAAMGYNASVLSIGTAGYPAIGGALAVIGWSYPFLMPLLALPIGIAALMFLDNPEPAAGQKLSEYFINVWKIVRQARIIGLFLSGILTFIFIYGTLLTYLPKLMDSSFKSTTLVIGLFLSSISVINAIVASQLERISKIFPEKRLIDIGFVLYAISIFLIPLMPSIWLLLIPAAIAGTANAINIPSMLSLLTASTDIKYRGIVMSLNGMVLRIGQTIGPPLMALLDSFMGLNFAFISTAIFILTAYLLIRNLISGPT